MLFVIPSDVTPSPFPDGFTIVIQGNGPNRNNSGDPDTIEAEVVAFIQHLRGLTVYVNLKATTTIGNIEVTDGEEVH